MVYLMKKFPFVILVSFVVILHGATFNASGSDLTPVKPSRNDKCIVCGMFVAKYPDWTSEIILKDGRVLFFDGCKDLFKYYFQMKKYTPGSDKSDISTIFVTEYYDVTFINALNAFFVIGSNVYGPMGRELIPFQTETDSTEFLKDHDGKQIIRFNEIKPGIINRLD